MRWTKENKYLPTLPKIHFFINADTVLSGNPLIAEKDKSDIARLMINMLAGVWRDFVLEKNEGRKGKERRLAEIRCQLPHTQRFVLGKERRN